MNARSTFWSRRRAAVAAEQAAEQSAERAVTAEARQPDAIAPEQDVFADQSDEDICAALGLPDPDSLMRGDDFSAFMARAVPEHLRRRALRRLWRSNPVLACLDGLNDYDDDFTDAACVRPSMKTAYQVGKGMTYHLEKMAEKARDLLEPPVPDGALDDEDAIASNAEAEDTDALIDAGQVEGEQAVADAPAAPPRRRLRITFAATDAASEASA